MTQPRPLPRWILPALVAATALVVLAMAGLIWVEQAAARADLPRYGSMPAFRLTDQNGQTVSEADFQGKTLLVGFIYTSCTDICPTLTMQMKGLQEELRKAGLPEREVHLLSVSVDPERDTPERLKAYAAQHGADTTSWRFLTGQVAMIRDVVVEGFLVGMQKTPAGGGGHGSHGSGPGQGAPAGPGTAQPGAGAQATQAAPAGAEPYEVSHSGRIVLVDKAGNLRAFYDGTDLDPAKVLADINRLR